MSNNKPIIYCLRQDLRLNDNPALHAAVRSAQPVILCYILDDSQPWPPGGASRWWLHHSLAQLDKAIAAKGGQLLLRRGPWVATLLELVQQTNASAVYWSRNYEPFMQQAEHDLYQALQAVDVEAKRFPGYLLFEPEAIRTNSNGPFKVFTPFWKACLRQPSPKQCLPTPTSIAAYPGQLSSEALADWELLPQKPDWAGGLREHWTPGEQGAEQRLQDFLQTGLQGYKELRNHPALPHTSRLSPHLHFGEISPRYIWHAVQEELAINGAYQRDAEHFLSELGWREFSYHLLHHWPDLPENPFRPQFANFPWQQNAAALHAWQRGLTGIPLIDAGMRELWHSGWMHNRVRMVVASFLVKNLLIHWTAGENWFWDTLVDANLANNAASWQWVAGSGADAAPYFRIFNPVTQAKKFDPDGVYIKHWVPELRTLSQQYLHAPWEAPADALAAAGIVLGKDYPKPLVDLSSSRQRALEMYQKIKV